MLDRRQRSGPCYAGLISALAFGSLAGPIAALVGGVYAAAGLTLVNSARRARAQRLADSAALDLVAAIAADLRAGADPEVAVVGVLPSLRSIGDLGGVLADRIAAACHVADAVGARLADLLDRLEVDARGLAKAHTMAITQAAGARATAWLLAGLPIAGLALGYGIGADPLQILFHTRLGAGLAVAAIAFQVAGLVWSQKLTRGISEAVR